MPGLYRCNSQDARRVKRLDGLGTMNRPQPHALPVIDEPTVGRHKDHAMTTYPLPVRHNRPTSDDLHPFVYRAIIGLTVWLVLSVWALFSRGTYEELTLSVITLFFLVLVGIPILIWLTWRRRGDPNEQPGYVAPFSEWASHPFETWTGNISGREASMQILLPIAAVSVGMTIFELVFLFA